MNLPTLHVDESSPLTGICAKESGKPVALEDLFKRGFVVRPEDAPAVLTLVQNFRSGAGPFANLKGRKERQTPTGQS
jgi:hypothetical protein